MSVWDADHISLEFEDGDAVFEAVEQASLARIQVRFRMPRGAMMSSGGAMKTLLKLRAEGIVADFLQSMDDQARLDAEDRDAATG